MKSYDEDLAYIHDVGHGEFARRAAPQLLSLLAQRGIRRGLIVDLGCGSGIWAAELLGAGYEVLGVDLSPAMVALARRRAPRATFQVASFLDMRPPPCRVVTALGEVLGYALDPKFRAASLAKLFRRIHAALEPGGLLIFDVADTRRHRGVRQSHGMGDDWAVLVDFERDLAKRQLTRRIVSFRKVDGRYRRSEEVHRLHLFESHEVAALLREAGFKTRVVRGYGDFRFGPGTVGFVARKPD